MKTKAPRQQRHRVGRSQGGKAKHGTQSHVLIYNTVHFCSTLGLEQKEHVHVDDGILEDSTSDSGYFSWASFPQFDSSSRIPPSKTQSAPSPRVQRTWKSLPKTACQNATVERRCQGSRRTGGRWYRYSCFMLFLYLDHPMGRQ